MEQNLHVRPWPIYCNDHCSLVQFYHNTDNNISHDHHHHSTTHKNLKLAFFLNLSFTIVEIIGGIFTNSLTILTDALHDLGDSVAIGISLYLEKVSEKETNDNFTFGFRRFSLLGALINALILIGGSTFMLTKSIPEIFDPSPSNGKGMLILAIFGVAVNGAAALKVKKGMSVNQKMVYLHLLEDAAGWLATIVGAVIMIFFDLPVVDPILSILITVYILYHVISSLRGVFRIMLQGAPKNIDLVSLRSKILKINGVEDILDFHYWTIDGENHIVTLHLIVSHDTSLKDQLKIKQSVRDVISNNNTRHLTIEFVSDSHEQDHNFIKH